MLSKVTKGIKITVDVFYQDEHSKPLENEFVFAYRIGIENNSNHTIQLLSRHWEIFDSIGQNIDIEGEGIVGKQPILEPGENHQYISGCQLKSEIGKMQGTYSLQKLSDGSVFKVQIPAFQLIVPYKLS